MDRRWKYLVGASVGLLVVSWLGWAWHVDQQQPPTGDSQANEAMMDASLDDSVVPSQSLGPMSDNPPPNVHGMVTLIGEPIVPGMLPPGQNAFINLPEVFPPAFDDRIHYLWYRGLGEGYDWVRRHTLPVGLMSHSSNGQASMGVLYSATFLSEMPALAWGESESWFFADTYALIWIRDDTRRLGVPAAQIQDLLLVGQLWNATWVDVRDNTYYFVVRIGNVLTEGEEATGQAHIDVGVDGMIAIVEPTYEVLDWQQLLEADTAFPVSLGEERPSARLELLEIVLGDEVLTLHYAPEMHGFALRHGRWDPQRLELLDAAGNAITPLHASHEIRGWTEHEDLFERFPLEFIVARRQFDIRGLGVDTLGLRINREQSYQLTIHTSEPRVSYLAPMTEVILPVFETAQVDMGPYEGVIISDITVNMVSDGILLEVSHETLWLELAHRRENLSTTVHQEQFPELLELSIGLDLGHQGKQLLDEQGQWVDWNDQLFFHWGTAPDWEVVEAIYVNGVRIPRVGAHHTPTP